MNRKTLIVLKVVVWVACLAPMTMLAFEAATNTLGPDPTARIALTTGYDALFLLLLSLTITPVRAFIPRLSWLIKFRRLLGLFAFFYACVHMLTYVGLYSNFSVSAMLDDIEKRRFIKVGLIAWLLLLPLAATSTTWAIRKLGGKNWQRLHWLVYPAVFLGLVHYWWQVKPGVLAPVRMTIVMWVLLLVRPVLAWRQRRRSRAA
jgi:sulfoxide reductase heme-binding subunit YedZ